MESMSADYERLAEAVKQARAEQRLSQADMRARGGPSTTTMSKIEHGTLRPIPPQTKFKLECALAWEDGAVDHVLAGGEPRWVDGSRNITVGGESGHHSPEGTARHVATLSLSQLWAEWVDLFVESLAIEMEYARRRGYKQPRDARDELLRAYLQVAESGQVVPPWEIEERERAAVESHLDELVDRRRNPSEAPPNFDYLRDEPSAANPERRDSGEGPEHAT